jgi:hypothetical protein
MDLMIVIFCPKTNQEVPTDIVVNISTFKGLPIGEAQLRCPACGEEHTWSVKDAMLATLSAVERATHTPTVEDEN